MSKIKTKTSVPSCPRDLKGIAKKEWQRLAPTLTEKGLLGDEALATFEAYCVAYDRWKTAEATVAKQGLIFKTKSGNVIQHPCLGIANTAMKLCNRYAAVFMLPVKDRHAAPDDEEARRRRDKR